MLSNLYDEAVRHRQIIIDTEGADEDFYEYHYLKMDRYQDQIIETESRTTEDITAKFKLLKWMINRDLCSEIIDQMVDSLRSDVINHLDTKKLRAPLTKETALSLDFPPLTKKEGCI